MMLTISGTLFICLIQVKLLIPLTKPSQVDIFQSAFGLLIKPSLYGNKLRLYVNLNDTSLIQHSIPSCFLTDDQYDIILSSNLMSISMKLYNLFI